MKNKQPNPPDDSDLPEPQSISELMKQPFSAEYLFDRDGITTDDGWITLEYSGAYEIDLARIPTPMHLVNWVTHLAEKPWMTSRRLRFFILKVCEAKGWDPHNPGKYQPPPQPMKPSSHRNN